ncbi:MAG: hypothetical protein ABL904_05295, partial [Hyphomicrobiaceae bacterium]
MSFTCSRPAAVRMLLLAGVVLLSALGGDAFGQSRRRTQEPPPPPEPLPEISGEAAKCSFAYHAALARIGDERARPLIGFENQARVAEPGLTGKWLYWIKTGRGAKPATSEQVCTETVIRSGRQRCTRWETRKIDAAIVSAQPSTEETAVLRSLEGFVTDKGAALEFGSNGRQFVTLQRVAAEVAGYSTQPRHPALCNGASEMLDFHATNLAGVKKRADDVAALAAKALGLARQRVTAAREQRMAWARAFNAALAASQAQPPAVETGETAPKPMAAVAPVPVPRLGPIAVDAAPAKLILLALEGMLAPEQLKIIEGETGAIRRLQIARELTSASAMPDASPATQAAAGAALRMVEAAAYGELQAARLKQFQ